MRRDQDYATRNTQHATRNTQGVRMEIPAEFARRVIDVDGDEGVAWLAALPDLLDQCARRWGLTLGPPFDLSYNYVAPAVRADGTEVVLKAGMPRPLAC